MFEEVLRNQVPWPGLEMLDRNGGREGEQGGELESSGRKLAAGGCGLRPWGSWETGQGACMVLELGGLRRDIYTLVSTNQPRPL